MTEEMVFANEIESLPTEIFIKILSYLSPMELMKCRGVCYNWKIVIDGLATGKDFWANLCRKEFNSNFLMAKSKADRNLDWYYLYRSLALWARIPYAIEENDEFASAFRLREEVRNVDVLGNGVVAVHKKTAIEYYDVNTFQLLPREPIRGEYARYTENEYVVVLHSYHLHLFVINRALNKISSNSYTTTFDNVKLFLLKNAQLYFVTLNDEIHVCNVSCVPYTSQFIKRAEDLDGVMSLGYEDGLLHILTYQRNIYTIVNNKDMVYRQSITSEPNLLNLLHKYNFLEQLDWRVYFQWMYVLQHTMPEGLMQDIICIRPYGDLFFVGTNSGVLCIFYKPYTNGQLDLFKFKPLLQVNFMERSDIPVLETCPILQIDLVELLTGHLVFVAMPKKVAVLKFTHNYLHPINWSVKPPNDIETDIMLYA